MGAFLDRISKKGPLYFDRKQWFSVAGAAESEVVAAAAAVVVVVVVVVMATVVAATVKHRDS